MVFVACEVVFVAGAVVLKLWSWVAAAAVDALLDTQCPLLGCPSTAVRATSFACQAKKGKLLLF